MLGAESVVVPRDDGGEGQGGPADVQLQGAHRRGHRKDAGRVEKDCLPAPSPNGLINALRDQWAMDKNGMSSALVPFWRR